MTPERAPVSVKAEGNAFVLFRNGKALETPLHFPFAIPSHTLASAIAEEYSAQGPKLDMCKMPLAQTALTAIDMTRPNRKEVIGGIARYAETELVCQRAMEPADLVAEQNRVWQPYIDWCQKVFGADLRVGQGLIPFEQNKAALAVLREKIENLDAFILTGLGEACKTTGSLVLGLALMEKRAGVEEVFLAAELDALWQNKKWGEDPVSQSRHADIKRDLAVCVRWFDLLKM